jgi:hypothetical protein
LFHHLLPRLCENAALLPLIVDEGQHCALSLVQVPVTVLTALDLAVRQVLYE